MKINEMTNSASSFVSYIESNAKTIFPHIFINLSDLSFIHEKPTVAIIHIKRNKEALPGEGKKFMEWLCHEADKNNIDLTLTVVGNDDHKLVTYYKQFGFEVTDSIRTASTMYRYAKTNLKEAILDGAIGNEALLSDYILDIEKEQNKIEDKSTTEERAKSLEKTYRALEAIKYVLKNNENALENEKLMDESIFLYEIDKDQVFAALHGIITDDTLEIKWVGSIAKGYGRKLVDRVRQICKQQGIKKIKLTSKWESEGFYDKVGFKKTPKQENPLTRAMNINNDYEQNLKEKVETISSYGRSQETRVLINPTPREAEGLFNNAMRLNLQRTPAEGGVLRYLSDRDNNLYMWDAYDLIHQQVGEYFGISSDDAGYADTASEAMSIANDYQQVRERKNISHELTEKIEKVPGYNGTVEYKVLVNPSPDDAVRLFMNMRHNYDVLRFVTDENKNLYMWEAFYLTHADVMNYYGIPDGMYDGAGVVHSAMDARRLAQSYEMERDSKIV